MWSGGLPVNLNSADFYVAPMSSMSLVRMSRELAHPDFGLNATSSSLCGLTSNRLLSRIASVLLPAPGPPMICMRFAAIHEPEIPPRTSPRGMLETRRSEEYANTARGALQTSQSGISTSHCRHSPALGPGTASRSIPGHCRASSQPIASMLATLGSLLAKPSLVRQTAVAGTS